MPNTSTISTQAGRATQNYILNALPDEDFKRLLPDLESVEMLQGKVLYRPDEKIRHVYFPDTAMVSVVTMSAEGKSVEAGVIGSEGICGFNVLLGVDSMPNENIVQLSGNGRRISASAIKREFERGGAFQKVTLRFIHALMGQIGQTALCNRTHTNEERLARWLLMCRDRTASDRIKITQEFLSIMLGTYRSTVTISALTLQTAGYIKYVRGHITILDRQGLEDCCCECYHKVKDEYERVQK